MGIQRDGRRSESVLLYLYWIQYMYVTSVYRVNKAEFYIPTKVGG